jgi:hypothetical protein
MEYPVLLASDAMVLYFILLIAMPLLAGLGRLPAETRNKEEIDATGYLLCNLP